MDGILISKRSFPTQVIIPNEKFKNQTFHINTNINLNHIETDSSIKIKEHEYNPLKLSVTNVKEATNTFDKIQIGNYFSNNNNSIKKIDEITVFELEKKLKSKTIIIIDTRDARTFNNGHIVKAELFNTTSRSMATKAKKNWDKIVEVRSDFDTIIVYNQRGDLTIHLREFLDHLKKDFDSVYFVTGGYEEFTKHFPKEYVESSIPEEKIDKYHFSPTNESNRSTDVLNATISEILPFLFIGNEMDSKDIEMLQEKKITHILNVTTNVPFHREDLFIHKRLSATDSNRQDMRAYYNEAFRFIDEAYSKNGKVLVHCWAGVSRSATIVAAYLLKNTKLSVLQTIMFLQSKRPIVEPNFNFLGQLERYFSDLEKGIESRSSGNSFNQVEQAARKIAAEHEKNKLSNNSSSSNSPNTPPPKAYFNFIK